MISVDYKNCCGCEACVNACPKKCICMEQNSEGFYYPKTDGKACIDCGICNSVCILENPNLRNIDKLNVYAAYVNNDEIRNNSSSGGVFTVLANYVIENDGVVYGAAFYDDWTVHHIRIDKKEDLYKIQRSKYVQSHIDSSYSNAKEDLISGKKVLFVGTGCQIDGLRLYLGKEYDNLYSVDVVCHGTPSDLVWKKYLSTGFSKVNNVNFRDKSNGWKKYNVCIGNTKNSYTRDNYMRLFLGNLTLRESCFNCKSKSGYCKSDLTIADFWGIDVIDPDMYDDRGASLVIVNNEKGKTLFDAISKDLVYKQEEFDKAVKHNPCVKNSTNRPVDRDKFFADFLKKDNPDFEKLVYKYLVYRRSSKVNKLKLTVKRLLKQDVL